MIQLGRASRFLGRGVLGQLDWLPTVISAGLQAGASIYSSHMNETIARMQKRTQEEIQARQEAAAAKAAADAAAGGATGPTGAPGTAGTPGATPKILGIDQSVFIAGGVGLALMLGVVAVVASKSSRPEEQSVRAAA